MTPRPHPQRCENCSNWLDANCMVIEKWLSEQEYNMIEMVGCASFNLIGSQIRSRPVSSPRIDTKKCFEDIVYSSAPWKIYRQDAVMGEHDYAVFLNDVFFCRTEHSQTAHEIIRAIRAGAP